MTQPRYTMEVMDINKNPAEVVQIGDEGYLLLTLHEVFIDFFVDCYGIIFDTFIHVDVFTF